MFLQDWTYGGNDPGLKLFTLANPLLPEVRENADVWEIGAHDTDWLERASACQRSLIVGGMDWRKTDRKHVCQGDVLTAPLQHADVFIGLSSIEHIGLGRYDNDPIDEFGDVKIVQRVRDGLARDGFFYFDVPYTPEGYGLLDVNKCRCYDDDVLRDRFGPHTVLGYTSPNVDGWVDKPTKNFDGPRPYWYVALLIENRKDGANTRR